MNTIRFLTLIFLFFFNLNLFSQTKSVNSKNIELEGVVRTLNSNSSVSFSTGIFDYTLDLTQLGSIAKKILSSSESKQRIVKVNVPEVSIIKTEKVPYGVRSDCSELPFKVEELHQLANSSEAKSVVDFLNKIPEGTLQTFSLVYNSHSAQKGEGDSRVSFMWPRVIRSSIDGKLTLTYICNPKSSSYNEVEVMYFDDKEGKFKTSSYDFKNSLGEGEGRRVHHNPKSCVSCHSSSIINGEASLKPNWPEYFQWSDCDPNRNISIYGGNDDNMQILKKISLGPRSFREVVSSTPDKLPRDCSRGSRNFSASALEREQFQKFKELQKGNLCYSSLPWAQSINDDMKSNEEKKWNYDYYPYSKRSQIYKDGIQNYSLRTNARITDTYSHLMAKRIASLMKSHVDYEKVKHYLVMEDAGCLTDDDKSNFEKLLKLKVNYIKRREVIGNPIFNPAFSSPILYTFGQKVGLNAGDWSMQPFQSKDPS